MGYFLELPKVIYNLSILLLIRSNSTCWNNNILIKINRTCMINEYDIYILIKWILNFFLTVKNTTFAVKKKADPYTSFAKAIKPHP
jgi:hypothetical protein